MVEQTSFVPQPGPVPAHVPPDLVTDFEPGFDPRFSKSPWQAIAGDQNKRPDIFWSRIRNAWVVARHPLILEVLQNPVQFSSQNTSQGLFFHRLVPIDFDPPEHSRYRAIVNPIFAPKAVDQLEARIRDVIVSTVEAVRAKGECEFVYDVSSIIPTMVFAEVMGLPRSEHRLYLGWVGTLLNGSLVDLDARKTLVSEIQTYLRGLLAKRKASPQNDIISRILATQHEEGKFTDDEVLAFCFLLFIAGLDTVLNAMSNTFHVLAQDPKKQAEVRAMGSDTEKLAQATEEFLRLSPIITMNRTCTKDIDFHGVQFKAGDNVTVYLSLANYDEREYKDAFEAKLDRESRHLTFSSGPHRCVGSHLARREVRILLEEWFKRIPEFKVKPGADVRYHPGVIGVNKLPLVWNVR